MFKDKNILLGVTGSIAAYKTANLASMLVKQHANVNVIMTKNAQEFIKPLVFETLTKNKCCVDTFERAAKFDVEHISLAQAADVVLIAPATANVIAKLANGIADDMLTTTLLACECPKLIAPAMNTAMYNNPVTQKNIGILKELGYKIIEPASGLLACGDTGAGKMPEPEELFDHIRYHLAGPKDMLGKKVIVTAGPTQEAIDPVRYITNHSSGKMGYALAQAAMLRGADVTLVSGQTSLTPPRFVKVIDVTSTQSMYDAVVSNFDDADYVFKAAAVSDYTPAETYDDKVKKKDGDMSIPLKRTPDILMELGRRKKEGQYLCGFSMETRDLIENSSVKLEKKNADMIVANNLKDKGSGFRTDTNMITLITKDDVRPLPLMSKFDAANAIIDAVLDSQKGDRSE